MAIVSQSSNIALNLTMQARGAPIAYVVCAGNQAQTGLAEIGRALAADDRVTAIGFYIEGVGDPAAFAAMVRDAGKPVVAIKAGRSAAAQAAAVSHTASLAGGDAASRAFFARCGVPLLTSLTAFLETLKLLHVLGPSPGPGICTVSCSGGEASLAADAAEGRALWFPPMTAADVARIRPTLNDLVTIANPLDYHTFIWGDEARTTACFAEVMATGFDLTLFILDIPRADRCEVAAWAPTIAAIKAAARRTGRRAAVVATLPENLPEALADDLAAAGVAPLMGLDDALSAAGAAAEIGAMVAAMSAASPAAKTARGAAARSPARSPAGPRAARPDAPSRRVLSEAEAKARLAEAGLRIPEGAVAATPAEAAAAARALPAPLALKRLGLAHKTEAGAVRLNLAPAEVEAAAAAMGPGPYLVEAMVTGGVAEMILGFSRDPAYGLVMTIGFGGVMAELLEDNAILMPPVSAPELKAAIASLRLAPLLTGYRGRPRADIASVIEAARALARFAMAENDALEELDVNPLIVTPDGAWAADALIVMREN